MIYNNVKDIKTPNNSGYIKHTDTSINKYNISNTKSYYDNKKIEYNNTDNNKYIPTTTYTRLSVRKNSPK